MNKAKKPGNLFRLRAPAAWLALVHEAAKRCDSGMASYIRGAVTDQLALDGKGYAATFLVGVAARSGRTKLTKRDRLEMWAPAGWWLAVRQAAAAAGVRQTVYMRRAVNVALRRAGLDGDVVLRAHRLASETSC